MRAYERHGNRLDEPIPETDKLVSRRYRANGRIIICPPEITNRFEWLGNPRDYS
jgi:hypothetical protein